MRPDIQQEVKHSFPQAPPKDVPSISCVRYHDVTLDIYCIILFLVVFTSHNLGRRSCGMIVQLVILTISVTAVAAFLTLWYFWVKKKIELSYALDDEEQVLFPFRYFSWILLGVLLVTCLAQVHFVRVSSTVHKNLAAMTDFLRTRQGSLSQVSELKGMIEHLRTDLDGRLRRLHEEMLERRMAASVPANPQAPDLRRQDPSPQRALVGLATSKRLPAEPGFDRAAGASTTRETTGSPSPKGTVAPPGNSRPPAKEDPEEKEQSVWSMSLNLTGQVSADSLRVRKRPGLKAPVMAKLPGGLRVKVTEKRLVDEGMWYRVITPSGQAGWVDFRYLKLNL